MLGAELDIGGLASLLAVIIGACGLLLLLLLLLSGDVLAYLRAVRRVTLEQVVLHALALLRWKDIGLESLVSRGFILLL